MVAFAFAFALHAALYLSSHWKFIWLLIDTSQIPRHHVVGLVSPLHLSNLLSTLQHACTHFKLMICGAFQAVVGAGEASDHAAAAADERAAGAGGPTLRARQHPVHRPESRRQAARG